MSVSVGQSRLAKVMKELRADFAEVRRYWSDEVAEQFEKNHIEPLALTTRNAVESLGQMGQILDKMKRECQ